MAKRAKSVDDVDDVDDDENYFQRPLMIDPLEQKIIPFLDEDDAQQLALTSRAMRDSVITAMRNPRTRPKMKAGLEVGLRDFLLLASFPNDDIRESALYSYFDYKNKISDLYERYDTGQITKHEFGEEGETLHFEMLRIIIDLEDEREDIRRAISDNPANPLNDVPEFWYNNNPLVIGELERQAEAEDAANSGIPPAAQAGRGKMGKGKDEDEKKEKKERTIQKANTVLGSPNLLSHVLSFFTPSDINKLSRVSRPFVKRAGNVSLDETLDEMKKLFMDKRVIPNNQGELFFERIVKNLPRDVSFDDFLALAKAGYNSLFGESSEDEEYEEDDETIILPGRSSAWNELSERRENNIINQLGFFYNRMIDRNEKDLLLKSIGSPENEDLKLDLVEAQLGYERPDPSRIQQDLTEEDIEDMESNIPPAARAPRRGRGTPRWLGWDKFIDKDGKLMRFGKDGRPEPVVEGGEKPCWDGYEQIGMKIKRGREVPNCVPIKSRFHQKKTFVKSQNMRGSY